MTGTHLIADDPDAEFPEDVLALAERLFAARPVPSAALVSRVHAELVPPARSTPEPPARALIAGFGAAGALLLVTGALVTFL